MPPPPEDRSSANVTSDSLAQWLAAAAQGDQAAFGAFYDGTAHRVFGLALRVLRDRAQAEEVTQEVYLQAWHLAAQFDPGKGAAISWLMTLAHRRAVDRVRSSESDRERDTQYQRTNHQTDHDSTAEAVGLSLEATRVRSALTELSVVQRQAIELAYFGGRTNAEIARITGAREGTTKTRIRDGLIRLRGILVDAA